MKHVGHILIAVVLLMFTSISEAAYSWDWLSLYPTTIEAVLRFDGIYKRNEDSDGTLDNQWEAGIRINQRGYILDPGIANFELGFEPVYIWGRFDISDDPQDLTGNNLSYLFRLNMAQGTPGPFSYHLSAARLTNYNSASLGGRFETEIETKDAAIYWKTTLFPMSLTFTDRLYQQDFLSGKSGATTQRDEHLQTLTVKGRSSKMNLFAEHQNMDDLVPGRELDFQTDRVNLSHNLPWGNGSNLASRFEYFDRRGFNGYTRLTLDENASIQHTENIFSLSTYSFSSVEQLFRTNVNSGNFRLSHQLYENLLTTASVSGMSQTSDPQDLTRWRTGIRSRYNKDFFGVGVSAGLGYSYGVSDRDSRLGLVEVVDESHIVPLGGAVILNRRFIINTTIIVTSADGLLVYTDGLDYTVFDLPEDLTQVQIIPGGRIEIDETILVSYKATALPSQEFSTTNTLYNLGIALSWMRFSHSYSDIDQKLLSGLGESFLNPRRITRTFLEFDWKLSNVDFRINAERRYNRYKEFETTSKTFRQNISWDAFGNTFWNLNFVESFTESTTLKTDLYNVELTVDWQPRMNLSIRPMLGAWQRSDEGEVLNTEKRDDQFVTAGLTLRWWYRKVTFNMAYHHNQRTIDTYRIGANETTTNEDRLVFNLTRRFW